MADGVDALQPACLAKAKIPGRKGDGRLLDSQLPTHHQLETDLVPDGMKAFRVGRGSAPDREEARHGIGALRELPGQCRRDPRIHEVRQMPAAFHQTPRSIAASDHHVATIVQHGKQVDDTFRWMGQVGVKHYEPVEPRELEASQHGQREVPWRAVSNLDSDRQGSRQFVDNNVAAVLGVVINQDHFPLDASRRQCGTDSRN